QDGEIHHGTGVAIRTRHTGDLTSHAAFDQGYRSEYSAFACLHEEGTTHRHHDGQPQRPLAINQRHQRITNSKADGEHEQSLLATAAIGYPATTGTRHQVHERVTGCNHTRINRLQTEGLRKEQRQHGYHREFRAERGEIQNIEYSDLPEFVAMQLRHGFNKNFVIDAPYMPGI